MGHGNLILETVQQVSEEICENPKWVVINDREPFRRLAEQIATVDKPALRGPPVLSGKPASLATSVYFELVAASVNFCYWYGRSDVRPGGATSARMYDLLTRSFEEGGCVFTPWILKNFYNKMVLSRFPMLRERHQMLNEVLSNLNNGTLVDDIVRAGDCADCPSHLDELLEELLIRHPGFAEDVFIKRASLFFTLLHQRFGWFADRIAALPVPADYQVPKMLRAFGVLEYHPALEGLIADGCPIQKNGQVEAEIRASTIVACRRLADAAGRNPADVDHFLWTKRKTVTDPFHLTLTTDY